MRTPWVAGAALLFSASVWSQPAIEIGSDSVRVGQPGQISVDYVGTTGVNDILIDIDFDSFFLALDTSQCGANLGGADITCEFFFLPAGLSRIRIQGTVFPGTIPSGSLGHFTLTPDPSTPPGDYPLTIHDETYQVCTIPRGFQCNEVPAVGSIEGNLEVREEPMVQISPPSGSTQNLTLCPRQLTHVEVEFSEIGGQSAGSASCSFDTGDDVFALSPENALALQTIAPGQTVTARLQVYPPDNGVPTTGTLTCNVDGAPDYSLTLNLNPDTGCSPDFCYDTETSGFSAAGLATLPTCGQIWTGAGGNVLASEAGTLSNFFTFSNLAGDIWGSGAPSSLVLLGTPPQCHDISHFANLDSGFLQRTDSQGMSGTQWTVSLNAGAGCGNSPTHDPVVFVPSPGNSDFINAFGGPVIYTGTNSSCATNRIYGIHASDASIEVVFNETGAESVPGIRGLIADEPTNTLFAVSEQQTAGQNTVWSVNALNGALNWAVDAGPIFSNPVLRQGRLFVASSFGNVTALDAVTGSQFWTADVGDGLVALVAPDDGPNNDRVFVVSVTGQVESLQDLGGAFLTDWSVSLPGLPAVAVDSHNLMALDSTGGLLFIAGSSGEVWVVDAADGNLADTLAVGDPINEVSDVIVYRPTQMTRAGSPTQFPRENTQDQLLVLGADATQRYCLGLPDVETQVANQRTVEFDLEPGANGSFDFSFTETSGPYNGRLTEPRALVSCELVTGVDFSLPAASVILTDGTSESITVNVTAPGDGSEPTDRLVCEIDQRTPYVIDLGVLPADIVFRGSLDGDRIIPGP